MKYTVHVHYVYTVYVYCNNKAMAWMRANEGSSPSFLKGKSVRVWKSRKLRHGVLLFLEISSSCSIVGCCGVVVEVVAVEVEVAVVVVVHGSGTLSKYSVVVV